MHERTGILRRVADQRIVVLRCQANSVLETQVTEERIDPCGVLEADGLSIEAIRLTGEFTGEFEIISLQICTF